jgi:hypothetical protein
MPKRRISELERNEINMVEMVIGIIAMLIAAVAIVFLILIAINIALFVKLRSIIPQKAFLDSEQVTKHAYTQDGDV